MKISKQQRRDAKQLYRSCLANGLLDEARVRQVVQYLVAQRPRGYAAILSRLHRLVRLDLERRTARVESAVPLSAGQQSALQSGLSRKYGAGLTIAFAQSPDLIGGLRVQVGSDVYDGSIRARLQGLAETF